MRKITVFDNSDFDLLANENGFKIDSEKEWKDFLEKINVASDSFLDYDQLNELILKFIGYDKIENIDKAFGIICDFEKNHPERYDNKN